MSEMPEKCSHDVRLRPNPARCIECEIVWEAMCLRDAEQAVARHNVRMARLCKEAEAARAALPHP